MTETVSGAATPAATISSDTTNPALAQGFLGMGQSSAVDMTAPGAVTVSQGLIVLNTGLAGGEELLLPGASGSSFLLSGDASSEVALGGYVFAPVNGATVSGAGATLPFLGGSDAVSVLGGNGETTMFGVTGTAAALFSTATGSLAPGGTGTPHVPGGTGSNLFVFIDGLAQGGTTAPASGGAASGATEPVIPAGGLSGGDMITLSDGTIIHLQGMDRSLFG